MKQIYKYLPYNPMMLWGTDNDAYYKRGEKYELEEILFRTHFTTYSYQEFVEYLVHNNAKPILRPFEDLTKPLPLTKAAAEMVGIKEGELCVALNELSSFAKTEFYDWGDDAFFSKESDRNFLRAMHFAVDFKEGEYHKLED